MYPYAAMLDTNKVIGKKKLKMEEINKRTN